MKLQLTCLAACALAITTTNAATCVPGDESDILVESVAKILVPSAMVCNVTDATNLETYYQLKPCDDKDCLELLNTFLAVVPDCEDGTGLNIKKKMTAVVNTCSTTSGGSETAPGPAPAATTAAPTSAPTKETVAAPAPANAAGTTTVAVTSVAVSAIAWLAMV